MRTTRHTRRVFLGNTGKGMLGLLGASSASYLAMQMDQPGASGTAKGDDEKDLRFMPAWRMAQQLRAGRLSSEKVVRLHLDRIREVNPSLNAVVHFYEEDRERALAEARKADEAIERGEPVGPLHGLPVTIKDSLDTAGLVTTGGTTGRKDYVPRHDATAVKRLREAGAIVVGKTNTPELTLDYRTENLLYGRTNNPYDLDRSPGGSSGGAAAIISVGGSPVDVGSDTAGSIRLPCHFCGIAGLKPTYGRVSRIGNILPPGGLVGEWTQIGPMARFVKDLALILPLISGPDGLDSSLAPVPFGNWEAVELGSLRGFFYTRFESHLAEPEIAAAVRTAAESVGIAGARIDERSPDRMNELLRVANWLHYGDGGRYYMHLLEESGTRRISEEMEAILNQARSREISGAAYSDLLVRLEQLKREMLEFAAGVDFLLCPVCSATAPQHESSKRIDFTFLPGFNILGWPVVTVRVATSKSGLPIGIQVAAKPWQEHIALAVAHHLENELGGWENDFDPTLTMDDAS